MKRLFLAAMGFCALPAHGALVAHWTLDEANGDYTTGGIAQQVGNTSLSFEVGTGTDVTEGLPGLALGGGTAVSFFDGATDTYINAGSFESTGLHVAGAATTPFGLGSSLTISGWFSANTLSGEHIFVSNQFNSNTGWMIGVRDGTILMDFGSLRAQYTPGNPLLTGQAYFIAVTQDLDGDTNFGWTTGSNHRISLYDVANGTWEHFDGTQSRPNMNLLNVSIGRFTNGGREWDGLVDDIRIYDNALDQNALNALVGIPEPSSLTLLALGLACACGARRRR